MLLTIDERGSKIPKNSVIQISIVANLDMSRGVPTCMQVRMCVYLDTASIGHSKMDNNPVLMTNGSLMKLESITECSPRSVLYTFDLHSIDNRS